MPARLCLLALMLATSHAFAHSRGETWSVVKVEGDDVSITYIIAANELMQHLPDIAHSPSMQNLLVDEISTKYRVVQADGKTCKPGNIDFRQTLSAIEVAFTAECENTRNVTITNDAFFEQLPNHLHIAQATIERQSLKENLFTQANRHWQVTADTGLIATFKRYLTLGIEHIITGYDHLAFLFAVMLLMPRTITLVLMITGFTIGHSITLALAVLGYANANSSAVEALIGFTIALVAAEVVAKRHGFNHWLIGITGAGILLLVIVNSASDLISAGPNSLTLVGLGVFSVCYLALSRSTALEGLVNPALTLLFGMIHGFGFAGLLVEIGLPVGQLIPALVGFNLGVEIGQLIVIAIVIAAALGLSRLVKLPWFTRDAIAAALCGLGLFLFVARSVAF